MSDYRVVEKFISINGEGRAAGEAACFIRFAGCNLSCGYCDTRWANQPEVEYELLSEQDIYNYVKKSGIKNVTLTGGEPLLQKNIGELIKLLAADKNLRVEIETNGAVLLEPFVNTGENVSFTMDYKLPGSGMESFMVMDNYSLLRSWDTVKFVVSDRNDLEVAGNIIDKYSLTERVAVYLSSAFGDIEPADIVDYIIENRMNKVRLQLQMHKYIWEPDRKGV